MGLAAGAVRIVADGVELGEGRDFDEAVVVGVVVHLAGGGFGFVGGGAVVVAGLVGADADGVLGGAGQAGELGGLAAGAGNGRAVGVVVFGPELPDFQ